MCFLEQKTYLQAILFILYQVKGYANLTLARMAELVRRLELKQMLVTSVNVMINTTGRTVNVSYGHSDFELF